MLILLGTSAAARAEDPQVRDARIVAEARLVAEGERVALYGHGGAAPDRSLLVHAESALERMEQLLGRTLDVGTLGPRIRLYVSTETTVSHVWQGYAHPTDPQGALFLNPKVARLGLVGRNATYAHELAHLLTWRFHSHTLREGLADWLALQLHPGAAVGPNADAATALPPVPDAVRALLGTSQAPPAALSTDPAFRAAYYAGSRRFVEFLIARSGVASFLRLYDSQEPEAAFLAIYGAPREALVGEALDGGSS